MELQSTQHNVGALFQCEIIIYFTESQRLWDLQKGCTSLAACYLSWGLDRRSCSWVIGGNCPVLIVRLDVLYGQGVLHAKASFLKHIAYFLNANPPPPPYSFSTSISPMTCILWLFCLYHLLAFEKRHIKRWMWDFQNYVSQLVKIRCSHWTCSWVLTAHLWTKEGSWMFALFKRKAIFLEEV